MGIVGHNNENFNNKNVKECEKLCCARQWCRSFDFVGNVRGRGTCALSDVDVSHNGATTTKWNGNVYEKPALPAPSPLPGPQDCARKLAHLSNKINSECCPRGGCKHGPPTRCSDECDQVWSPFQKQCSVWVSAIFRLLCGSYSGTYTCMLADGYCVTGRKNHGQKL